MADDGARVADASSGGVIGGGRVAGETGEEGLTQGTKGLGTGIKGLTLLVDASEWPVATWLEWVVGSEGSRREEPHGHRLQAGADCR